MSGFVTILVIALVTAALRFIPVYLPGRKGQPLPPAVLFLIRAMPAAIIALLVVYSLKSASILAHPHGIPEAAGLLTAALLQQTKKNTLLSVFLATACYIILIRIL